MRQEDIYLADLRNKGSEQAGRRPIVIVSGNMMNEHFEVVIVCPISSVVKISKDAWSWKKGRIMVYPKIQRLLPFKFARYPNRASKTSWVGKRRN